MTALVQEAPGVWTVGSLKLTDVHAPERCAGRPCVVHAPSDHPLRDWTLWWREDTAIFERLCPQHGVGHPDPDDVAYQVSVGAGVLAIHGCCGCCERAAA